MTLRRFCNLMFGVAITCGSVACSSSDSNGAGAEGGAGNSEGQTIELLSYWAIPGQVEGMQKLIGLHKDSHPNDQVINEAIASTDWDSLLAARVASGKTPDLYVQQLADVAAFVAKNGEDFLQPLDEFLALPAQADILPNLPADMKAALTVNGKLYAVPSGFVSRANALFYNKQLFADNGVTVPSTIEEFTSACQTFKAAGVNCVTTTYQTLLFEGLLAGSMGVEAYYDYRRGGPPDEAALRKGVDLYADVVDNYLDPAALRQVDGTQDAEVTAFMSGQAAMYFIGDWTKFILPQLGWTAGVDYGISAAPGNAGLFAFAADVFTIPRNAPHPAGALSFLETILSTEGQKILVDAMSTPARTDVKVTAPDQEVKGIVTDWRDSKYHLPANTKFIWEGPLQQFVHTSPHDKDALLQVLMTLY